MIIFETKGKITPDSNKTNLVRRFDVPDNLKTLKISFSYSPKALENREKAIAEIKSCFEKYNETMPLKPADCLPVKNLVTISADDENGYRGAAHRQDSEQEHIISEDYASPGFIKGKITQGEWDIILNVHSISCDVDYILKVEGEEK